MPIKFFRNSVLMMLVLVGMSYGQQAKPSTVEVSQEFLNSSSRAFEEVVLLRIAVDAQAKLIDAQAAESKAKDELIISERAHKESILRENATLKEQVEIYKKMTCDKSIFLFIFKKVRCK